MYLEIYERVMADLNHQLPNAVQHITRMATTQQQDEADFYTQWPDLKAHSEDVLRIGRVYRQMNPTATKEQFIQDVGLQSMIHLRLPIQGVQGQGVQQTPPPVEQAPPPYVPPQGGAVNTPPSPQKPSNPFTALAEEWEELE